MSEERVGTNAPTPSARAEDERIHFIKEQVFRSLKVKSERWNKFIALDENKKLLLDFLDERQPGKLLFTGAGGALHVDQQLSFPPKSKMLYIFKNCSGRLSNNDQKNELMLGEILQHPVEHLTILINEVLVPILSNTNNHLGWPQAVCHDVRKYIEIIKSKIFDVHGQMEGKTILPLPLIPESIFENQEMEIQAKYVLLHLILAYP
ncbi:dynein beta chain, ciliary-like [Scyliorhinus torazame]|uniref:dynein beta chain, ciliary-like n=1 Tax=Scyliorhinus torazame TaxID=75743 RepID=UPI003B594450